MAALFTGKLLVANRERDEVETERELHRALENKVLLLYFGSGQCPRCRRFAPLLKDFFVRLTDEFYVDRASQLVLVYVSRDETEEQQSAFLRSMPERWLAVPFGDAFGRYVRAGQSPRPPPAAFPSWCFPFYSAPSSLAAPIAKAKPFPSSFPPLLAFAGIFGIPVLWSMDASRRAGSVFPGTPLVTRTSCNE